MGDPDQYYEALRHRTTTLRRQLLRLAPDDSSRVGMYQDLLWCYQETTALLWRRIVASQRPR